MSLRSLDLHGSFILDGVKSRLLGRARQPVRVGRFDLLQRLGHGGMGVVYEAVDPDLGEHVALKTVRGATHADQDRLRREFRSVADLDHPNLVRLYELGVHDGELFFTMELVHGEDMLATCGKMQGRPVEELVALLRDLASAVAHLHSQGVVHCDIKPANVLVDRGHRVVLLDFGLAEHRFRSRSRSLGLVGTPPFLAPELRAGDLTSPASDVYALGQLAQQAALAWSGAADAGGAGSSLPTAIREALDACVRSDPSGRPTAEALARVLGGAAPAREPERVTVPMVGRDAELARLREVTQDPAGCCVAVSGPSGIGKTTLARALAVLRESDGWQVCSSRCYEREAIPYRGVDTLVEDLAAHLAGGEARAAVPNLSEAERSAVCSLFPVLRRVDALRTPGAGPGHADDGRRRRLAFGGLAKIVATVAADVRLLVWIDDLQWCDADSIALLRTLLQTPRPPVAFVFTLRREAARHNPDVASFVRDECTSSLELRPLDDDEAVSLLSHLIPSGRLPDLDRRNEAAGNPFLLLELADYAGSSEQEGASLGRAVRRRVEALHPSSRRLLDAVALAGHPIALRTAVTAAEMGAVASRAAGELRSNGLIIIDPSPDGPVVKTRHDRVREATLEALTPDRRRELHGRLAETLRGTGGASDAQLAIHYHAAGMAELANACARRGAAQAAGQLAFDHAAQLWGVVVETNPAPVLADLIARADALRLAGRPGAAARAYETAAASANGREALVLERQAAHEYLNGGELDRGRKLLEKVLPHHGLEVPASAARAVAGLAMLRTKLALRGLHYTPRQERDIPRAELERVDACWSAAQGIITVDVVVGANLNAQYTLLALECGERKRIARALALEAGSSATPGPRARDRALRLANEAEALARDINDAETWAFVLAFVGTARLLLGDAEGALARGLEAQEALADITGAPWTRSSARTLELNSLQTLGRLREFCQASDQVLGEIREGTDAYHRTSMRAWTHIAKLVRDDLEGARHEISTIRHDWPFPGFHIQNIAELSGGARVSLYAGDGVAALQTMHRLWPAYRRSLIGRIQKVRLDTTVWRGRSAVATYAQTRQTAAQKLAANAARQLRREEYPGTDGMADAIMAGLARADGNTTAAAALLARAVTSLTRAGMALEANGARLALGWTRGDSALVDEAQAYFDREAVVDPVALTRMTVPPFGPPT